MEGTWQQRIIRPIKLFFIDFWYDLLHSRRIQIGILFATLSLLLASFGGFALLELNSYGQPEATLRIYRKYQQQINFPNFQIESYQDIITDIHCSYNNSMVDVAYSACPDRNAQTCYMVNGSIYPAWNDPAGRSLSCDLMMDYQGQDRLIGFSISDLSPLQLVPNLKITIELQPSIYKLHGDRSKQVEWSAIPYYSSGRFYTTAVTIELRISNFNVLNYEEYSDFSSWMFIAAIGGLFSIINYTFFGVCFNFLKLWLPSDSIILSGDVRMSYATLRE